MGNRMPGLMGASAVTIMERTRKREHALMEENSPLDWGHTKALLKEDGPTTMSEDTRMIMAKLKYWNRLTTYIH